MRAVYVSANQSDQARANTLGLGLIVAPGTVTPFAFLQGAGFTFTLLEPINAATLQTNENTILAAEAANDAAAATLQTNATTITTNLTGAQTTIQNWITANPTGAVLTAAQTLVVARMLNGLCKILLAQYASTTGT